MSSRFFCPLREEPIDCLDPNTHTRELEAYGDISGIGVLTGFVGTGYLALILLLGYYLLVFDPNSDLLADDDATSFKRNHAEETGLDSNGHVGDGLPLHNMTRMGQATIDPLNEIIEAQTEHHWRPNLIDNTFLDWIRGLGRENLNLKSEQGWTRRFCSKEAFNECIINICEIQALTGIAILVSAYASICEPISAYHWQMAVYMAWFSSVTHMAGLTGLRDYFLRGGHKARRVVLFTLMALLVIMLTTALVPTAFFDWEGPDYEWTGSAANYSSPAVCFYDLALGATRYDQACVASQKGHLSENRTDEFWLARCHDEEINHLPLRKTHAMQGAVFSACLLVFTFFSRSVMLFGPPSRLSRKLRGWLGRVLKKCLNKFLSWTQQPRSSTFRERLWEDFCLRPSLATVLTARFLTDLVASVLSEVFILAFSLAWGTVRVLLARRAPSQDALLTVWGLSARSVIPHEVILTENKWTFGQTIPVVLLAAPILTTLTAFAMRAESIKGASSETDPNAISSLSGSHPVHPVLPAMNIVGIPQSTAGTDGAGSFINREAFMRYHSSTPYFMRFLVAPASFIAVLLMVYCIISVGVRLSYTQPQESVSGMVYEPIGSFLVGPDMFLANVLIGFPSTLFLCNLFSLKAEERHPVHSSTKTWVKWAWVSCFTRFTWCNSASASA